MTIALGKVEEKRGWFDNVDDWLKRDRFVFVGWSGILLFPCAYFAVGGWFTGTTFVTSWYTHGLASSYLEGCNFLTSAVSTPSNSMAHSLLLLWGPEAQGEFTRWCQLGGLWTFVALHGAFGLIGFMLRQFEIADQARTIRIPVHMIETINKIVRTTRQIMSEIGREPTPNELADRLHMPLDKVKKVLKIAKEPISLETPVGDEEDSSLGDFIEDKNALIPIDAAVKSSLRDTTTRILSSLTPREERVLRMRFGIGMNSDHTLEEVGQQFSVTRERIRQIEAKALRKLKHPTRARKLKTFLDE